jgi:hypothetical protein
MMVVDRVFTETNGVSAQRAVQQGERGLSCAFQRNAQQKNGIMSHLVTADDSHSVELPAGDA